MLTDYYVSNGTLAPGQDFTLTIEITNYGSDAAQNVFLWISSMMFNDNYFSVIDAFVSSISSNKYYVHGSSYQVVARTNNITLADVGIDNISDIMYAERMVKDPTAKLAAFYFEFIEAWRNSGPFEGLDFRTG